MEFPPAATGRGRTSSSITPELSISAAPVVDTSDGGSITVTGNSNVTVGGTRWTGNVTIGANSSLSLTQVDFKSSEIILDGIFHLGVCGIDMEAMEPGLFSEQTVS